MSKKIIAVLALLVVVATLVYTNRAHQKIWHYRMTVVLETPEGTKSGSAVREVIYRGETHGGGGAGLDLGVKGEAVAVDLGKRGILFGLLNGETRGPDYASDIVLTAFNPKGNYIMNAAAVPDHGRATLAPEDWPEFVSFKDLNDPASVQKVIDGKTYDDRRDGMNYGRKYRINADRSEEIFGQGVHLREVTLEMTDEPVTVGIVKLLPWLSNFYDKRLDGRRFETIKSPNRIANQLASGNFSTELSGK